MNKTAWLVLAAVAASFAAEHMPVVAPEKPKVEKVHKKRVRDRKRTHKKGVEKKQPKRMHHKKVGEKKHHERTPHKKGHEHKKVVEPVIAA